MNQNTQQPTEIDLKDLIIYIFKHTSIIIVASIVFALFGVAISCFIQTHTTPDKVASVLDTSSLLPGESEEAYNNRVDNVERAYAVLDNISVLTNQAAIQNDYINNSVYMKIDPLNTAATKLQVVIVCDNSIVGGIETLYNAYSNDITRGDYINNVADSLNYTPGATQELISCNLTTSGLDSANSSDQMGVMNVSIIGQSIDDTEAIAEAIITEIELKETDFYSTITPHTITVIGSQSSVGYDGGVRKSQLDAITTLNTIQSQINNLNNSLDSIAKNIGLEDRTSFYDSFNSPSTPSTVFSVKTLVLFGVISLLFGVVLTVCIYILKYIFGRSVYTQMQYFSLVTGVARIGVCKPLGKRTRLQIRMELWANDDSSLSKENTDAIIAANFGNLVAGMDKILITGTVNSEYVRESIKSLGITGDTKLDLFSNPSVLSHASEYDGIVLVEQRGVSKKKIVMEQSNLLMNSGTKIIGAIIL